MTKPKHWTWFKFDWKAWRHDPLLRRCSKETRGFWIDCIAAMEEADTYFLEGTPDEICREVNATRGEFESSLLELERTGAATVLRKSSKSQDFVKLVSRRILKAVSITEYNKIKQRERRLSRRSQDDVKQLLYKDKRLREEDINNNVDKYSRDEGESEGEKVVNAPPADPKTTKRGTRLPDDFLITDEMKAWAAKERPDLDLRIATLRFCNHFRSAPGAKGLKLNWVLTWQNWILGEQGNGKTQGQRKTNIDLIRETKELASQYPSEAELNAANEREAGSHARHLE